MLREERGGGAPGHSTVQRVGVGGGGRDGVFLTMRAVRLYRFTDLHAEIQRCKIGIR